MAGEALTPMMQQYFRIKTEVPQGAFVMFRLGDFYELFGEDAVAMGGFTCQAENDTETPYGGFAYIRVVRENGVRKFEAWLTLKIKFQEESQSTNTKEGNIAWNTPVLNGRAASLLIDSSNKNRWRVHYTFDTIAAAKSWINTVLNISTTTT